MKVKKLATGLADWSIFFGSVGAYASLTMATMTFGLGLDPVAASAFRFTLFCAAIAISGLVLKQCVKEFG